MITRWFVHFFPRAAEKKKLVEKKRLGKSMRVHCMVICWNEKWPINSIGFEFIGT